MSLGARNSKRSRSQSLGLLFRGDRQGVVAPVRQDGGGAETRRAARNERKQKTAVLQGAARPQAVKRSRARETRRQKKGTRDPCRNRVSAMEFGLGRERASVDTPDCGAATQTVRELSCCGEKSKTAGMRHHTGRACRTRRRKTGAKWSIDDYAHECASRWRKTSGVRGNRPRAIRARSRESAPNGCHAL